MIHGNGLWISRYGLWVPGDGPGYLEMGSEHLEMNYIHLKIDSRHMRWVLDKWKCNIATCRLTLATWTWILVSKFTLD